MRMLDTYIHRPIQAAWIGLTAKEAKSLIVYLQELLENPEAVESRVLTGPDPTEVSVWIVTPRKLRELKNLSEVERLLLEGEWDFPANVKPELATVQQRAQDAEAMGRALPLIQLGIAKIPLVFANDLSGQELERFFLDNSTLDPMVDGLVRKFIESALIGWRKGQA